MWLAFQFNQTRKTKGFYPWDQTLEEDFLVSRWIKCQSSHEQAQTRVIVEGEQHCANRNEGLLPLMFAFLWEEFR